MDLIYKLFISSALFIAGTQPSLAVMPSNQLTPSNTTISKTTGPIERGGTVTSVDLKNKLLIIDGVRYALPATPAVVHTESDKNNQSYSALKAGTMILFNTSKNNFSAQEQITEIWITRANIKKSNK